MDNNSEETKKKGLDRIIDASSLINLKAELLRKQEFVRQAKLNATNEPSKVRPFRIKGELKPKDQKRETKVELPDDAEEENLALRKSRDALEAKSKLYDQIMSKKVTLDDAEDEMYLVDFHSKVFRNDRQFNSSSTTEKTEPVNRISAYDYKIPQDEAVSPNSASENDQTQENGTTHYQNVHFNEKRDFGVGYFSFSTTEEKRKQQMDELNAMHNETRKRRKYHNEAMEKKKQSLESRLAKICRRRNIDSSVVSNYTSDIAVDNITSTTSDSTGVDLSSIPLPENQATESKPEKIRPWDVGKPATGFQINNSTVP